MVKFYLAGRWDAREDLFAKLRDLEQQSDNYYIVTYAWMRKNVGLLSTYDAVSDIRGVQECDVFIAVFDDPAYPYRGTFTELGAALGLRKLIYVVCPPDSAETRYACRTNVFFEHPHIRHVETWTALLQQLGVLDKTGAVPAKRVDSATAQMDFTEQTVPPMPSQPPKRRRITPSVERRMPMHWVLDNRVVGAARRVARIEKMRLRNAEMRRKLVKVRRLDENA